MYTEIKIRGARANNLKNINVDIPKNRLVAITGPSGSGKSSFAFDILQKECQRQYMESMGLVTNGMNKADVDSVEGLSPSISISQGIANRNPRSTVGTFTEILTYIRVLYAKIGERSCPNCGELIQPESGERCKNCGTEIPGLTMAHFSFNKPEGFCETCHGLGVVNTIDISGIVNENLTLGEGALELWGKTFSPYYASVIEKAARHYGFGFDISKKVKDFNSFERAFFLDGIEGVEFKERYSTIKAPKTINDGKYEGLMTYMKKKAVDSVSKGIKNAKIERCFSKETCPDCNGTRLKKSSREVLINGKSITEVSGWTLDEIALWIDEVKRSLRDTNYDVLDTLFTDITKRINRISQTGIGYLTADRMIRTLSGGEAQRLRLANIIDSGLTGVLYVLDEPTSGLHPSDMQKLLAALKVLRDKGNTVLVIEHDMDFVAQCDHVIDFGPLSGVHGGEVIAEGTPDELLNNPKSLTGRYLRRKILVSGKQMEIKRSLKLKNVYEHNLKHVSVDIPLNQLVCVAGVSGSGKSTLIFDVLAKYHKDKKVKCDTIEGFEAIDRIITIDQKPVGRLSRSNVATYTDIFEPIRKLFSSLKESKEAGLKPKDFSFNVKGGRCEHCGGLGVINLDMHFLEDVTVQCPVCKGKRFNEKILNITYREQNITDVLNMTVEENLQLFSNHREIKRRLHILNETGLGYLKLGQPTSTLSGGECQRIKLSKQLGRGGNGNTLYLLDEPTTGLHPGDVEKLLNVLQRLVDEGNSMIVVEHSLDVIAKSDWIIELGPEGGVNGGNIIFEGTLSQMLKDHNSKTGMYF